MSNEVRRIVNLPCDTPAERFGPLAGIVGLWRDRWSGDRLPGWRDFDFYDFTGWHGLVYVDEVVSREPLEFRCRLWGTGLVDLLGYDETGRLLSESPAASEPGLIASNRRIICEPTIGVVLGRALSYRRQRVFSVVKLPCATNGVDADHVIGISLPDFVLDL